MGTPLSESLAAGEPEAFAALYDRLAARLIATARCRPGWIRRLLIAVAMGMPILALVPWVASTAGLTAIGLPANWFALTFTAFVSAIVGGA